MAFDFLNEGQRDNTNRLPGKVGLYLGVLALILLAACSGGPAATIVPAVTDTPTESVSSPLPQLTQTPVLATTTQPEPTLPEEVEEPQADFVCDPPAALTPPMTEGPYYKSGSPERTSLVDADTPGTPLIFSGYVLTADCLPIAGAWLDFWQTDGSGAYDNVGYMMRGHQFTDQEGRYYLETVVPGIYSGRTAHIHVKVQAPDGPVLTSQLFFPNIEENGTDSIFDSQLLVALEGVGGQVLGTFNFIVDGG